MRNVLQIWEERRNGARVKLFELEFDDEVQQPTILAGNDDEEPTEVSMMMESYPQVGGTLFVCRYVAGLPVVVIDQASPNDEPLFENDTAKYSSAMGVECWSYLMLVDDREEPSEFFSDN